MKNRSKDNIKITQTISRGDLSDKVKGVRFDDYSINAMFTGAKTHSFRKPNATPAERPPIKDTWYPGTILYVMEDTLINNETDHFVYTADLEGVERYDYEKIKYRKRAASYIPKDKIRLAIQVIGGEFKGIKNFSLEEMAAEGLLKKHLHCDLNYFDYVEHFYKYNTRNISEKEAISLSFKSMVLKQKQPDFWYDNSVVWSYYFTPMLVVE